MITKEGHNRAVDLYGLGALLHEMIYGYPPHYSQNEARIFFDIVNKPLEFPNHIRISLELKDLLSKDLISQTTVEKSLFALRILEGYVGSD